MSTDLRTMRMSGVRLAIPVAFAFVQGAQAQTVDRNAEPPDALYRERGYGQGGLVFGLGRGGGDLAQAGACADLAFARLRTCGARGRPGAGYGFYGNGLGKTFGW